MGAEYSILCVECCLHFLFVGLLPIGGLRKVDTVSLAYLIGII